MGHILVARTLGLGDLDLELSADGLLGCSGGILLSVSSRFWSEVTIRVISEILEDKALMVCRIALFNTRFRLSFGGNRAGVCAEINH